MDVREIYIHVLCTGCIPGSTCRRIPMPSCGIRERPSAWICIPPTSIFRPRLTQTGSTPAASTNLVLNPGFELAATDNSGVTIRQTVRNLTAGARYTFSGQVNIPTSSDPFTLKLQVVWRTGDTVLGTSTIKTYTASTSGWNLATASFNAPTGTTNTQVQIVASSLNRTIYLDEFVFRR